MAQTAEAPRRRRFIWTDKVALAVGLSLLALIGALWLFVVVTVGSAGAQHMLQKSGSTGLAVAAVATGALWVVLQGIDFVGRGIWRCVSHYRGRARLSEGSLINGQPFRGIVTAALPFEATPALAPLMARPTSNARSDARTRSNVHDLRARASRSLEAV